MNNINTTETLPLHIHVEEIGPEVQTYNEEILNSLSHGIGFVLCIPAVFFLLSLARMKGSKWHVLSCSIYGISLMTMYFCSALYHSVEIFHLEKYREFFKDLDHCAIYMLIAGTYSPLTAINLIYNNLQKEFHNITSSSQQMTTNGEVVNNNKSIKKKVPTPVKIGWAMLIIVWSMCVLGVGSKLILGANGVPDLISNSFYLIMGWTSLVGLRDLIKNLPKRGLKLLVGGGITYTLGVIFLIWETQPFNHAVWHLFVGFATILHYFCILESYLPSDYLKDHENQHDHHQLNTTTTTTTTTHTVSVKHHSIILEHLEYAEKQIHIKFFGGGKRRTFIVKYMSTLYHLSLGWYSKGSNIKREKLN